MSQKIIVTVTQGQGKADLLEQIELNAVQGRPPMRLAVKPGQRIALLEKRRHLMNDWATFLDRPSVASTANVTQLRKRP